MDFDWLPRRGRAAHQLLPTIPNSRTGEKIGFADLGKFTNFLKDKTEGRFIDVEASYHE